MAAAYTGFLLLGVIGAMMLRKSFQPPAGIPFDPGSGRGLLLTALSISLDSLGVGIALPAAAIPLVPLLITISLTTTLFTYLGMAFGALLGERVERGAEGLAGAILIVLAAVFVFERLS
jgi:putative Mn2+ efflux pump MntP